MGGGLWSAHLMEMLYLFYLIYIVCIEKKNGEQNPEILAMVVTLWVVFIFLFILLYIF